MFGLDYKDSSINIYQEYQQFKSLPYISSLLEKGKPIEYGAKCIYEGGVYSVYSEEENRKFIHRCLLLSFQEVFWWVNQLD